MSPPTQATKALQKNQRRGLWLPKDRAVIQSWLGNLVKECDQTKATHLDPSILHFQKVVESDPKLKQLGEAMFTQVPDIPPYNQDPTSNPEVRSFDHFLQLLNLILKKGPEFLDPNDHSQEAMGLIGFPINAILDWPMGTKAGYVFWLLPKVNTAFFPILDAWHRFLASPASQACLEPSKGWTSPDALTLLAAHGNDDGTTYTFAQLYKCDPSAPYLGFASWDAFFTRTFNPGVRPVAAPDGHPSAQYPDPSQVIVHSCESAPLQVVHNVSLLDSFWLKGQPYSVFNMLGYDALADDFVGGTVYQAFLSALSYHRWHAPVSGRVRRILNLKGTYYSENYYQGFANPDGGPDPAAANNSQPFISAVATRGVIFIEADNAAIGLMAIVYIGMAEVSSCEFIVKEGQHVTKGQDIGMFHFGGSTHCMLFRPETDLQLIDKGPWDPNTVANKPVNSAFAVVPSVKK